MIESVSRRAFSTSSGSYNVKASEEAKERRHKSLSAIVLFLDDTEHTFHLDKNAKGQVLLDSVFQHLELLERDYFGLQYSDSNNNAAPNNPDVMRWLDHSKPLKKQLRGGTLYFRVKFYASDPSRLQEEYTRYQFYLQVRKDIISGRLRVPTSAACLLASYTVQSELGDYNPDEHNTGYLSSLALIPGQTEDTERKICELHKLHKSQTPADAEFNFLDHAKRLDMYGVDLHKAKDCCNKEIQLGVTWSGLVVFQNSIRVNTFSWCKIVKISFKKKQFFIQLRREPSENYDTLLGFNMVSYRSCKSLWKCCVEHHTFFRLNSPHLKQRKFPLNLGSFGIGSRFSYTGRTEFQTVEEGKQRTKLERTFIRSPSRRLIKSVSTQPCEEKTKPSIRTPRSHDNKVTSLGSREPRRAWDKSPPHDDNGFDEHPPPFPVTNGRNIYNEQNGIRALSLDNTSLSQGLAYVDEDSAPSEKEEDKQVIILNNKNLLRQSENKTVIYVRQEGLIEDYNDDGYVTVTINPDEQGRFGFNVKGGADLETPVLVSRVAPNTPADRCYPKLSEGDQVIYINGIDISKMTHDTVVNLIRTARDNPPGELVLTVKPNVLYEAAEIEEPAYQYVPEVQTITTTTGSDVALAQSMLLLEDGLASGAVLSQFDQLYRKKPGLSTNEAKKNENVNKNRYRDISPYDETRVILLDGDCDYINANYVNMEIPGSGIVNRYIATQGPLSSTVDHFWQMVLEAGTGLIVMLTPLLERGRIKCHQYWPNMGEILKISTHIEVNCVKEETDESGSFVFREFIMKDVEKDEERDITHMQYIAWPDHGVPDSPTEFLSFTQRVRTARAGMVEPTLVHCSAGIGRTGVLILMETALCLMEANEPVYPLDIVRSMRDQRAMMIQTSSQYRFVCESVVRAYTDEVVKPLPQFQR